MHLGVMAGDKQKQWFTTKFNGCGISIHFIDDTSTGEELCLNEALLILNENAYRNETLTGFTGQVFFNEVIKPLAILNLPDNFHRINGWNTFLERRQIEICSRDKSAATNILNQLNWEPIFCPDVPGFISARIVAMVINEAWFAFGENISTTEEIDVALKLGTNYPFGPFEWANKIGLQHVYNLLKILAEKDDRYNVAPALENAVSKQQ